MALQAKPKTALERGVPSDIRKIAHIIPPGVVVEVGGGEGVLALALSKRSDIRKVVSIDLTPARTTAAQELKNRWLELGIECSSKAEVILGDAIDELERIEGADTVVASPEFRSEFRSHYGSPSSIVFYCAA